MNKNNLFFLNFALFVVTIDQKKKSSNNKKFQTDQFHFQKVTIMCIYFLRYELDLKKISQLTPGTMMEISAGLY